jgi:hypothetical protein
VIQDGEGVGGKNPAPLNGKRSSDPGTLDPEVKTSRRVRTKEALHARLTAREREDTNGSHTLF